ncbi:FMN-binding glutamate synthase family protein [Poseidonibacter lekithochrous]|uniref:FMN-binding glutamate synthase family protein n=1 Tax=Poseidonibacter lekithochrous TaxID=1904463 RepID=UPI0008FC2F73|nr:FMN-binding glutamate synthase family protein [Poseidonibacter lekithochrous]QKJ23931.1 FMN-binding glutamate synthase family protein [Poseidonibacter lekithochrous]
MNELSIFGNTILSYNWSLFFKGFFVFFVILSFIIYIYDRFIQRNNQLLKNYPLVGRMRYFFYLLRDPMRQYFGDEDYFDSYEKIDWINRVSSEKKTFYSFSPSKPYDKNRILFKHSNHVLNVDEVDEKCAITFGAKREIPFMANSLIGRSAMSDGAISPEGTQAFTIAALKAGFPINTGEGSVTTNYLITHKYLPNREYFEIQRGTIFARSMYWIFSKTLGARIAKKLYCDMVLQREDDESFNFDKKNVLFYRVNWKASFDKFPKQIPEDVADIVFQMGSGLYGVKHKDGSFDESRYKKIMTFCRMTEIKISQGAKQTGGKLPAHKVTASVAYYRGVEANKDLISPNRFPFASTMRELFDFIGKLQSISSKPVGIKIVISSKENFEEYSNEILYSKKNNLPFPDFLTIDGGDGGSGAAPLEMMRRIGLPIKEALDIVISDLKEKKLKDEIKIIASEKVLAPDDALELFIYGADFINIARGFMISAGCIRARHCSGTAGHDCPVGLATMNKEKRGKYLVEQKARTVANYHNGLITGIIGLLAVMGKKSICQLNKDDLLHRNRDK